MFLQITVSAALAALGLVGFANAQDSQMERHHPFLAQAVDEPFIDYTHIFTVAEARAELIPNTTARDPRKKAHAARRGDAENADLNLFGLLR